MAGIRGNQSACGQFQHSHPGRDKHFLIVVGADRVIGPGQDLRGRLAKHRAALQYDLGGHHKERGGYPFPGDVCHHQAQMVIVYQEEIVKVSSNLSCGLHESEDVDFRPFRKRREDRRQHRGLNACCQGQLGADTLPFCGNCLNIADILLHAQGQRLEGLCQHLGLVSGVDVPCKVQIIALHRSNLLGEQPDRLYDLV